MGRWLSFPKIKTLVAGSAKPSIVAGSSKSSTASADVATETSGIAVYQSLVGHVPSYDATRTHQGEASDSDTWKDGGPSPNRSTALYQNWADLPVSIAFLCAIRVDSARQPVVGQNHTRTQKNAILKRDAVIDENAVLYLAVASYGNIKIDIRAFADDAVGAKAGAFADLRLVPYACSRSHDCLRGDFGSGMHIWLVVVHNGFSSAGIRAKRRLAAIFHRHMPDTAIVPGICDSAL